MDDKMRIGMFEIRRRLAIIRTAENEYLTLKEELHVLMRKVEEGLEFLTKLEAKNDLISAFRWLRKCRKLQRLQKELEILTPIYELAFQKWKVAIDSF